MPEIGEIARVVHYIRKHLVGKMIRSVQVQDDPIVYGKVGTTATQFKESVTGKKVVGAGQQGKYFWLLMSSPPHPLLHASMTGWMHFSNDDSSFYKSKNEKEIDSWPPKSWKFILETDDDEPSCQAAFVDPRRLGRIRLIDCEGDSIRQTSPLVENGPDPVQDKDMLTEDWFVEKVKGKRVPVKAFLLDQANISGVGNWVADEVLFQARIHPEQYTHTLSDQQLTQLHKSLLTVCAVAVETLADQERFPKDWLMKYRWGKGKDGNQLPTGEKIIFLTVGGRTSAVVPSLQKKTGAVSRDVAADESDPDEAGSDPAEKGATRSKSKPSRPTTNHKRKAEDEQPTPSGRPRRRRPKSELPEDEEAAEDAQSEPTSVKPKTRSGRHGKGPSG